MYRREHRNQLSLEDFFLPFGGKLSGDNRWIKLAELIPSDELEDDYAAQFCKGFGAPAKPFRMVLGALIIKARMGLTDKELVEQIKENPNLQFFLPRCAHGGRRRAPQRPPARSVVAGRGAPAPGSVPLQFCHPVAVPGLRRQNPVWAWFVWLRCFSNQGNGPAHPLQRLASEERSASPGYAGAGHSAFTPTEGTPLKPFSIT
jgi:hypothetical protein